MLTMHSVAPLSINFRGMYPSLQVKSELSLIDPRNTSLGKFKMTQVFHCDGLLLCTSATVSTFVVWNPCTDQTKWIRPGNLFGNGRYNFFLGYYQDKNKPCNKSYKILSRYIHGDDVSMIYDFDSDSWRIVDDVMPEGWKVAHTERGVSLKGNTYWLASHATEKHLGVSLLKFDFSTENSEHVPLPYQCPSYQVLVLSSLREEKLSVLLKRNDSPKTEVWATNKIGETKVVSWSKVLAFDLSPHLNIGVCGSFLLDEEKKVVVCCDRWREGLQEENKLLDKIYIVGEDNKVTQVSFGVYAMDEGGWPAILNYVPSLVKFERAGGKRRRAELDI